MRTRILGLLLALFVFACGGSTVPAAPPQPVAPPPTAAPAPAQAAAPAPRPHAGMLPDDVTPEHYTLSLVIDPTKPAFTGIAVIRVHLTVPRRVIWMHGQNLQVDQAVVAPEDGQPLTAQWHPEGTGGLVTLRLPRAVGPGEATLRVRYTAPFDTQLEGLYKVHAGDHDYAFTQFEPLAARLAFPGFDEPRFKTPYDVTLTVPADQVAIANTHAVETTPVDSGMKRIRYATTEPLPTYLVAWAVGPFDVETHGPMPPNDVRHAPLPFRAIAVHGRGGELGYALDNTPGILAALESYFGTPYPWDKLDILAVPDFEAGAMENAGAVTFRDTLLLLDPEHAPLSQERGFAFDVAHELSHQWTGDLVTMHWWDDLWLNEAFASFLENRIVEKWKPDYQPMLALQQWVLSAMEADSLASARSIRQPIESRDDIHNAFDDITYGKGAGVIAMFENYLGADTFQRGLRDYIAAHRFGTATADDLLHALSNAWGHDVTTPFHTFLDQPGVPMLEASLECGQGSPTLTVQQSRFAPIGSSIDTHATWQVPVCVHYQLDGHDKTSCRLITAAQGSIALEGDHCPDWVMPNAHGVGYYRFHLPAAQTDALRQHASALDVRERVALADSLAAAFRSGRAHGGEALGPLATLVADPSPAVASAPMELLSDVGDHVVDDAHRAAFRRWAAKLYQPLYRRLGWKAHPGESDGTRMLRTQVLGFLALEAEDAKVRREAARRGRAYVGYPHAGGLHPDAAPPDTVGIALKVAVQDGDAAFFDAVLDRFHSAEDGLVRRRILLALGSTRDPALAARARGLALDPQLRVNEIFLPLYPQLHDPATRDATWAFIKAHFDALAGRMPPESAGYAPAALGAYCDAQHAADVQSFFASRVHALPGGPRNLAEAVESIRLCAALVDAQRAPVQSWLAHAR